MDFKISIVSPVFNEEEILPYFYIELLKTLKDFDYEIIFIDDGSSDNSLEVLKNLREKDKKVKIIQLKKNYGQQVAILLGLNYVKGDLAVVLDADLQDNPFYIPKLIEKWQKGVKIVFARRIKRKDSLLKKTTAYLFYRLMKIINPDIALDSGDFYLLDKIVVEQIKNSPPKHLFLRGFLSRLPYKKGEILIERKKRAKGKSGYSLKKMLGLAWNAVMLSFCHSPLSPVIPAKAGIQKTCNKYFPQIKQTYGMFGGKTACIIGGGISGLATGYLLSKEGIKVTVLEKSGQLGGLLQTIKTSNGSDIEKYYHHIFKTDKELLALISELNISDKLKWHPATTSLYQNQNFYSFSKPTDLFRSPLTLFASMKLGIATLLLPRLRFKAGDRNAKNLIMKYIGKEAWKILWRPLFEGKFGEYASEIGAPWFISRLKSRMGTREKGKEVLGYMNGSFRVLIDTLSQKIKENGGEILLSTQINSVSPVILNGVKNLTIETQEILRHSPQDDKEVKIVQKNNFDYIISTISPNNILKLAPFTKEEKGRLESIKYIGAICSVIELKNKLTDYYWNNILDEDILFKGIIEHTNLISTAIYGGNHILYLSHYTKNDSEYFRMNVDELRELYLKHLEKISPNIRDNIISFSIFKAKNAQPIIPVDYDPPSDKTSIPNFFITSMAHIYPEDRGLNQAVCKAIKIKDLIFKNHK